MEKAKVLEGEVGWDITLNDINSNSRFIINSYGGDLDTGWAGYDLLSNIEGSEVGVIGVCASSATLFLLGASVRWGSKNSKFCIHNPWAAPVGDARELQKTANQLQKEQDKLVALYEQHLSISKEDIIDLMLQDKLIDADKALEIGLIQEIKSDTINRVDGANAKAVFFNLKRNKMSNDNLSKEELQAELDKHSNTLMDKIKNLFGTRIKNILLKDANGAELDFSVDTEEEIAVGVTATVDGSPAEGDYVMPSGETYMFSGGELTEIKEAAPDEMEALQKENEELKAKLAESETAQAASEEKIQNLTKEHEVLANEVNEFKNVFSEKISNFSSPEGKQEKKKESSKAFKNTKTLKI